MLDSKSSLIIWNINADVFNREKYIELKHRLSESGETPQIIAINEVKAKNPKHSIELVEYQLPGYSFESLNLLNSTGRGMVLYILSSIKYSPLNFSSSFVEAQVAIIEPQTENQLVFGSIYRSPTCTLENTKQLNSLIDGIMRHKPEKLLLMGDFNYPSIDWTNVTVSGSVHSKEFLFVETLRDNFLSQLSLKPTRGRGTNIPSTLDLVIVNDEHLVKSVETGPRSARVTIPLYK